MQNTRLTQLLTRSTERLTRWFRQPWRRLSVQLIGLLGGFFLGSAVSSIAGQVAQWDVVAAGVVLGVAELIARWAHRSAQITFIQESLNFLRIGVTYNLFVDAFKLGS